MSSKMRSSQPSDAQPVDQVEGLFKSEKADGDMLGSMEKATQSTHESMGSPTISKAHQDYLMERHGTLELDPLPSMDPADPYNWPAWKVCGLVRTNLLRAAG